MKCNECGASLKPSQKFCRQCGKKIQSQGERITCINCNNYVQLTSANTCPNCGHFHPHSNLVLYRYLTHFDRRLSELESNITQLLRGEKVDITPSTDTKRVDIYPEEQIVPETKEPLEEEKISVESTPEVKLKPIKPIEPVPEIINPSYPKFTPFTGIPEIELDLTPLPLPNRAKQILKLEKKSLKQRFKDFYEESLLTAVGVIMLILLLLASAQFISVNPVVQSLYFLGIGTVMIFSGAMITRGKFLFIKSPQYTFGTLMIVTGFLLAMTINLLAIAENPLFFLINLILLVTVAYLGYNNDSNFTINLVTIASFLMPLVLLNTNGWNPIILGILSFGGFASLLIFPGLYASLCAIREKTPYPSIFTLLIGPIPGLIAIMTGNEITLYSIGVLLSAIPVAITLAQGKMEIITPYIRASLALTLLWPSVSFITSVSYMLSGTFNDASLWDVTVFTVGMIFIIEYMTSMNYGSYRVSLLVRRITKQMRFYLKYGISFLIFLESLIMVVEFGEMQISSVSQLIGLVLIPTGIVITATSSYAFISYTRSEIPKHWVLNSIISEISMAVLGVAIINVFSDFETIIGPFIFLILFAIYAVGNVIDRKVVRREDGQITVWAGVLTLMNTLLFVLSGLASEWVIGVIFIGFLMFIPGLIFQDLPDFNRLRLNQTSMFGNLILISLIQAIQGFSLQINDLEIGALLIFASYIIFTSISAFILHKYIIPHRIKFEPDVYKEQKNLILRATIYFESKLLENQEISFTGFIVLLFTTFSLTSGFHVPNDITYLVLLGITPLILLSTYLSRRGHWAVIVPGIFTLLVNGFEANDTNSHQVILVLFLVYTVFNFLLARIDRGIKHERYATRMNLRDISLWLIFIGYLGISGLNLPILWYFAVVSFIQIFTFISDYSRRTEWTTGFTLLLSIVFFASQGTGLLIYSIFIALGLIYLELFLQLKEKSIERSEVKILQTAGETLDMDFDIGPDKILFGKLILPMLAILPLQFQNTGAEGLSIPVIYLLFSFVLILLSELGNLRNRYSALMVIAMTAIAYLFQTEIDQLNVLYAAGFLVLVGYYALRHLQGDEFHNLWLAYTLTVTSLFILDLLSFDANYFLILEIAIILVFIRIIFNDSSHSRVEHALSIFFVLTTFIFSRGNQISEIINHLPLFGAAVVILYFQTKDDMRGRYLGASLALANALVLFIGQDLLNTDLLLFSSLTLAISLAIHMWQESNRSFDIAIGLLAIASGLLEQHGILPVLVPFAALLVFRQILMILNNEDSVIPPVFLIIISIFMDKVIWYFTYPIIFISAIAISFQEYRSERLKGIAVTYSAVLLLIANSSGNEVLYISSVFVIILSIASFVAKQSHIQSQIIISITSILSVILFTGLYDATSLLKDSITIQAGLFAGLCLSVGLVVWNKGDKWMHTLLLGLVGIISLIVIPQISVIGVIFYLIMSIISIVQSVGKKNPLEFVHHGINGAAIILLGEVLGSRNQFGRIFSISNTILDNIWLIAFSIWLVSVFIEVIMVGITVDSEIKELKVSLIEMNSVLDLFSIAYGAFAFVFLLWSDLPGFSSIFLFSIVIAWTTPVVLLINQKLRFTFKQRNDFLFTLSLVFYFLTSLAIPSNYISSFDLPTNLIIQLFIWGPSGLVAIILSIRSSRNNNLIHPLVIYTGSLAFFLIAVFPSIVLEGYVVLIVTCLGYTILAGNTGDRASSLIATSVLYIISMIMVEQELSHEKLAMQLIPAFFLAVVIFLYSILHERKNGFSVNYDLSRLLSTIGMIAALLVHADLEIFTSSNPELSATITIYLSTIGTLLYLYAIKLTNNRFGSIGMLIIYANIFRGAAILWTRINDGTVTEFSIFTWLSYLWLTVTSLLVAAVRSMSRSAEIDNTLKRIFLPKSEEK